MEVKEYTEEDETQPKDYLIAKLQQVKPLARQDSSMCMIASPDCSLTPRKGRKLPSPFEEESEFEISNSITDKVDNDNDFDFDDLFEKDFGNTEIHDLLNEFRQTDYLDLDSKGKKPKPFRRKDTSSCIIAPPDFRLTPRKLKKSPSLFTNILSDHSFEDMEKTKDIIVENSDTPNKVTNLKAGDNDIMIKDSDNNEIEETNEIVAKDVKKKPTVETDIRIRNYCQSLIPINVIRHRFRVERREDDVEDFLNYV